MTYPFGPLCNCLILQTTICGWICHFYSFISVQNFVNKMFFVFKSFFLLCELVCVRWLILKLFHRRAFYWTLRRQISWTNCRTTSKLFILLWFILTLTVSWTFCTAFLRLSLTWNCPRLFCDFAVLRNKHHLTLLLIYWWQRSLFFSLFSLTTVQRKRSLINILRWQVLLAL